MANYNKVILVGNLTRDPQMKYLPSQMAVVEFGIAVNHKYKTKSGEDREEVMFIDCSAFGRGAEVINQYCQKGKQILVEGRLKYDTWEDKQGGGKRSKHVVVIDNFQLLGGRQDGGEEAVAEIVRHNKIVPLLRSVAAPQQANVPEQPFPDENQFKEDDIPF